MPRGDRWPSRWWFWAFPALANAYLVLVIMLRFTASPFQLWVLDAVVEVMATPGVLFIEEVAEPTFGDWGWIPDLGLFLLLALGLWELAAAVVGVAVYGGALLVYAIVGEPSREGEGNSDG